MKLREDQRDVPDSSKTGFGRRIRRSESDLHLTQKKHWKLVEKQCRSRRHGVPPCSSVGRRGWLQEEMDDAKSAKMDVAADASIHGRMGDINTCASVRLALHKRLGWSWIMRPKHNLYECYYYCYTIILLALAVSWREVMFRVDDARQLEMVSGAANQRPPIMQIAISQKSSTATYVFHPQAKSGW